MEKIEYYQKIDEEIAKFKNGKELYQTSASFNRVIHALVRGANIYELLEQIIVIDIDLQKAFETHIITGNYSPYVNNTYITK